MKATIKRSEEALSMHGYFLHISIVHVTRELIKAGKILEIDVLDHIIIGHNRFTSLKERGMGFE
jgi:Na+-transporting NADH:ubiquinone oxidoreductase subunit NqrD